MKFSIVIPSFNYAQYISEALSSALSQTAEGDEVIVIDDGSQDETRSIVNALIDSPSSNGRLKYYHQENQGVSSARNYGVQSASGDFVIFLDADDRLLPGAVSAFRARLEECPRADLVLGGNQVSEGGRVIKTRTPSPFSDDKSKNFERYIRGKISIPNGGSIAIRRKFFDKIQYPVELRTCEDYVVFAQLMALCNCEIITDIVIEIVKHDDSLRNRIDVDLKSTPEKIVRLMFDEKIMPEKNCSFRNEVYAYRCMTLFRSLFLLRRKKEARAYYHAGIKAYPAYLSQLTYLRKYIKMWFK